MNLLQKELGRVMRSEVNIIKQYIFILHVSCIILHSPIDRLQLPPPPLNAEFVMFLAQNLHELRCIVITPQTSSTNQNT